MEQSDLPEIVPVKVTVERRWQAARRLAAGDDLHLAAARAGLHEDQVALMLEKDQGFVQLIAAARTMHALPAGERHAAALELAQEALEDQLGARNATVLNNALRLLPKAKAMPESEDVSIEATHAMLLAALSWDELADYLWIGVRDAMTAQERAEMPFEPPEDFAERVRVLNSKLQHLIIQREGAANDDHQTAAADHEVEPQDPG